MEIPKKIAAPPILKLLLIDDERWYATEFAAIVKGCQNPSFLIDSCTGFNEALEDLQVKEIDVVLLGVSVAAGDFSKIRAIHKIAPQIPVIVLAGLKDEETALHAVAEGAQDYLIKSDLNPRMITRVIQYALSRKRAEVNIRKVYERMELLLAALPSILIGVDTQGKVTQWNAVAESTFRIDKSQILGKKLNESGLKWDQEKLLKGIEDCFKKQATMRVDDVRFKNGESERVLGFKIIPIGDAGEDDSFALLFGADITERKQLENLKDEFVSTVSHELRTPLLMIREGVCLVHDGILGPATDEQKKFLNVSLENIDRLSRIINDLLDISKIEAAKMKLERKDTDLGELLRKLETGFAPVFRGEVKFKICVDPSLGKIPADPDKLNQVFTNLIQNAAKFTEKGFVEAGVCDKGDRVECYVADSGSGIAPEDIPLVFNKFQQFGRTHGAGAKGTGLGLSICKGLVELHGGKIWIESQFGKGTRFAFSLPKK